MPDIRGELLKLAAARIVRANMEKRAISRALYLRALLKRIQSLGFKSEEQAYRAISMMPLKGALDRILSRPQMRRSAEVIFGSNHLDALLMGRGNREELTRHLRRFLGMSQDYSRPYHIFNDIKDALRNATEWIPRNPLRGISGSGRVLA